MADKELTRLEWAKNPPETGLFYTAKFSAGGAPLDLANCTVTLVCELLSGGQLDVTSLRQTPYSAGVLRLSFTSSQLNAASAGSASAKYLVTKDGVTTHYPHGGTFTITFR